MNTDSTKCPDLLMSGNCTKGGDCTYCNDTLNINLNVNAKNYLPKSKRAVQIATEFKESSNNVGRLEFNLNATEYNPKISSQLEQEFKKDMENLNVNDEDEEEDDDDYGGDEFDMIMKDIINNEVMEEIVDVDDDDESDDEKWFPKYKDCECCKGFVYKCNGVACVNMGTCYCKMKEECDDEDS